MSGAALGVASAVGWTFVAWVSRRRAPLATADEGYLWYGVQRALAGEQPVRDFRSYEPGRYWLCCLVALLPGVAGVVRIRLAAHLVLGAALAALGTAAGAAGAPAAGLVVLPLLVLAWEGAQEKMFDVAALVLVAAAGVAALGGGVAGHLALGAAVALAASMGLNLCLYGLLAALVVLADGFARGTTGGLDVVAAGAGGLLGLVPLLVWWGVARGTWTATVRARVSTPLQRGSSNLPLPVPWPWRPSTPLFGGRTRVMSLLGRATFVVGPASAAAALGWSLASGQGRQVVVPVGAVGLVALHHTFSRADFNHLGRVAGLLFAAPALLPGVVGLAASAAGAAVAALLLSENHPLRVRRRSRSRYVRRLLGPDELLVRLVTAAQLDAVAAARRRDEQLATVPFGPLPVAATGLRSAVRDTYCVYPATPEADEAMRTQLADAVPVLVLVDSRPLNRNPALAFPVTHPLTWEWLRANAEPVRAAVELPATVSLLRVADR